MRLLTLIFVLLASVGCQRVDTVRMLPSPEVPTETPVIVLDETVTPDVKGKKPWAFVEIDEVVKAVKVENLRDKALPKDDLEIRAWAGFGLTATQGFILNRTNGQWTAFAIRPEFKKPRTFRFHKIALTEPRQSWQGAWQSLLNLGILTLPDAEKINCSAMIEDGYSYVVEARKGDNYRTYSYDNPAAHFENRCREADNIVNIARSIANDYRATDFSWGD